MGWQIWCRWWQGWEHLSWTTGQCTGAQCTGTGNNYLMPKTSSRTSDHGVPCVKSCHACVKSCQEMLKPIFRSLSNAHIPCKTEQTVAAQWPVWVCCTNVHLLPLHILWAIPSIIFRPEKHVFLSALPFHNSKKSIMISTQHICMQCTPLMLSG